MEVEVRVFATLRKYLNEQGILQLRVEEGTTIRDLIKQLQLPEKEITIIMVNGVRGELDQILESGDRAAFFPPIGGG